MGFDKRFLSKKLYGNNTPLRYNIAGQIALGKARIDSSNVDNRHGLFDLPSPKGMLDRQIDSGKINKFSKRFDELIEEEGEISETPGGDISQRLLTDASFDFLENGLNYREIFPDEADKVIKESFGSNYRVISFKAYRNYHRDISDIDRSKLGGLIHLWHMDSFAPSFQRVFIPLHDIEKKHGPTQYISKKDTRKVLKNYKKTDYSLEPEKFEQKVDIKDFTVDKGSPYVLNPTEHLHKAGIPEKGEKRDIAVFNVVPDSDEKPRFDLDYENIVGYRKGYRQLKNLI